MQKVRRTRGDSRKIAIHRLQHRSCALRHNGIRDGRCQSARRAGSHYTRNQFVHNLGPTSILRQKNPKLLVCRRVLRHRGYGSARGRLKLLIDRRYRVIRQRIGQSRGKRCVDRDYFADLAAQRKMADRI